MIDRASQDKAVLYLLGDLPVEERTAFEERLRREPELRAHVAAAGETLAELALDLPAAEPSAAVRERVLAAAAGPAAAAPVVARFPTPPAPRRVSPWGWVAAAAAIALALFFQRELDSERGARAAIAAEAAAERNRREAAEARATELAAEADQAASARAALERRIAELEGANRALLADLDQGKRASVLGRIVAGAFRATVAGGGDAPGAARGAFVWDPETQEGVITVENLPLIPPSYDYEIWVADAGQPVPVGTFHPTRVGRQTWPFKATARISRATEFMVTRERRGGAAKIEGPALLVSDRY